jgi:hypothetical protein
MTSTKFAPRRCRGFLLVIYLYFREMKRWYTRITPFTLIGAIAILGMLYFLLAERNSPAEVRYTYLVLLLPLVLGMLVVDVVFRYLIKKQLWLWIAEVILLFGVIYLWIISDS